MNRIGVSLWTGSKSLPAIKFKRIDVVMSEKIRTDAELQELIRGLSDTKLVAGSIIAIGSFAHSFDEAAPETVILVSSISLNPVIPIRPRS